MTDQNTSNSRSWIIFGVAAAFVLLAALVAVFIAGSDDPSVVADDDGAVVALSETRPVTVSGTPLPAMPEQGTDAALGLMMPELSGASFDGTPVTIENDGKPKIIIFLAHW